MPELKANARGTGTPNWIGILFTLVSLSLALAACGPGTPTPFPVVTGEAAQATSAGQATSAEQVTETSEAIWQTFHSPRGGFSVDLPDDWEVEERGETSLGLHFVLGPEPLGPGPASSMLFVADAGELTAQEAAEGLACDDGCEEEIELEEATVGDAPAQRVTLGTEPPLEWYFVSDGQRLVYFSIHDPDTFATRKDIVDTFTLEESESAGETGPTPTATATATVEPTPAPEVTVEAVRQWQEVVVEDAGLSFEAPADWSGEQENVWTPSDESALSLHFAWQQVGPQAAPEEVLDAQLEIMATEPLALSWGAGISATVDAETTVQRHQILQVGLRAYDFYVEGPNQQALDAVQPVLDHVVESVTIQDRLLYLEDPVDAAIDFFEALLRDPSGEEARPYLSAELQQQLDDDGDSLSLLDLSQRFHTFNLDWQSGSETEAVLEGTLTLVDDSTVARNMHLVYDEAIGWRIDAIESPPDTPAES